MYISRELFNNLNSVLADFGEQTDSLFDDYSGRRMYGATCLAMRGDSTSHLLLLDALDEFPEDVPDEMRRVFEDNHHTDSLGRGVVHYWPGIQVEPNCEDHLSSCDDDGYCNACGNQ